MYFFFFMFPSPYPKQILAEANTAEYRDHKGRNEIHCFHTEKYWIHMECYPVPIGGLSEGFSMAYYASALPALS